MVSQGVSFQGLAPGRAATRGKVPDPRKIKWWYWTQYRSLWVACQLPWLFPARDPRDSRMGTPLPSGPRPLPFALRAGLRLRGVAFATLRSGHPGPGNAIRDVPAGESPGHASGIGFCGSFSGICVWEIRDPGCPAGRSRTGNLRWGVPDSGLPSGECPGDGLETAVRGSGPGFSLRGVPGFPMRGKTGRPGTPEAGRPDPLSDSRVRIPVSVTVASPLYVVLSSDYRSSLAARFIRSKYSWIWGRCWQMVSMDLLLSRTEPLARYSTEVLSEVAMRIASFSRGYIPFTIHP